MIAASSDSLDSIEPNRSFQRPFERYRQLWQKSGSPFDINRTHAKCTQKGGNGASKSRSNTEEEEID